MDAIAGLDRWKVWLDLGLTKVPRGEQFESPDSRPDLVATIDFDCDRSDCAGSYIRRATEHVAKVQIEMAHPISEGDSICTMHNPLTRLHSCSPGRYPELSVVFPTPVAMECEPCKVIHHKVPRWDNHRGGLSVKPGQLLTT